MSYRFFIHSVSRTFKNEQELIIMGGNFFNLFSWIIISKMLQSSIFWPLICTWWCCLRRPGRWSAGIRYCSSLSQGELPPEAVCIRYACLICITQVHWICRHNNDNSNSSRISRIVIGPVGQGDFRQQWIKYFKLVRVCITLVHSTTLHIPTGS